MDGNADVVQGTVANPDISVPDRSGETYAQRTARGLVSAEDQAAADAINREASDESNAPVRDLQRRGLTSFEREHFHPLNVTPDRPCSAFFRASQDYTTRAIIDSFIAIGIPAKGVKCLQRKSSGEAMVTFSSVEYCNIFLEESSFSSVRRRYTSNSASEDLEYLTIFDAPYELPDSAIVERLKPFCNVVSKRWNRVQGYPDVCNGIRTYRVRLLRSVPCYLRFGKFQLRLQHAGQVKTCRRCGMHDHLARDCTNEICFNCDTVGHVARSCPEEMRCCICKDPGHRAIDCPFSWHRRPISHQDAGASDAAADAPSENADAPPESDSDIDDDPPVLATGPESGADSLAGVLTPAIASGPDSLAGVLSPATAEPPNSEMSSSPSVDDSQLESSQVDMSQLTDDSLVAAAVDPSMDSQPSDSSNPAGSTISDPPAPDHFLDSQGYVAPRHGTVRQLTLGPNASLVLTDLALSDEEEEYLDPLLSTHLARPAKVPRKKIGRRAPAKLTSSDAPPLRRATAPNLITSKKPVASKPPLDLPSDLSDVSGKRKDPPLDS